MQTIDSTARRLDEVFRQGEQFSRVVGFYDYAGALVTSIASARVAFFGGTLASPTTAVSGVTVAVSISASTYMSYTLTSAQTRQFTVGSDYCYCLEATLADGSVVTILQGEIKSATELA